MSHDAYPAQDADTGAWIAHAQAEADNLDVANARQKTSVDIVRKCEAHDAALVKGLTRKPFLGLF